MVRYDESEMTPDENHPQVPLAFRFKNLGPIRTADLELGDLTIIAGRNNTGKTYLTYTLYGFLKMWEQWSGAERFVIGKDKKNKSEIFPDLHVVAEQLVREGQADFPLSRDAVALQRAAIIKRLSNYFSRHAMSDVFSNPDEFRGASIEMIDSGLERYLTDGSTLAQLRSETGLLLEHDGSRATVTAPDRPARILTRRTSSRPAIQRMEYYLSHDYGDFLLTGLLPDPFILSAERFGISLFYRELDFTKNQLVDLLQRMADDKNRERTSPFLFIDRVTSRYALPIKDNIDYTRSIPDIRSDKSDLHRLKFFDYLKDMMEGYYSSSSDEIRFISKSRGKGRSFNIPLHVASSSARELSDFYFYLRHVARKTHLVMIDEPESHLDTANQIRLARLLAQIVNAGVRVLITTHSDYLIKEFNNLVMLSQQFSDKEQVVRKLKYDSADLLEPTAIRAYVAENNSLTKCNVDRFGVDMPMFDKTIDDINYAANELAALLDEK